MTFPDVMSKDGTAHTVKVAAGQCVILAVWDLFAAVSVKAGATAWQGGDEW